ERRGAVGGVHLHVVHHDLARAEGLAQPDRRRDLLRPRATRGTVAGTGLVGDHHVHGAVLDGVEVPRRPRTHSPAPSGTSASTTRERPPSAVWTPWVRIGAAVVQPAPGCPPPPGENAACPAGEFPVRGRSARVWRLTRSGRTARISCTTFTGRCRPRTDPRRCS